MFALTTVRLQKNINYLVAQLELLAHSPRVDVNQLSFVYASIMHSEFANEWPFKAILPDLDRIMREGYDESELTKFHAKLKQLFSSIGQPAGVALHEDRPIVFAQRTFCFTGVFELGVRKDCFNVVVSLGGEPKEGVSRNLDYLVIGKYSSPDWKYSKFGTKIKEALEMNADPTKKHKIRLVSEDFFTANSHSAKGIA